MWSFFFFFFFNSRISPENNSFWTKKSWWSRQRIMSLLLTSWQAVRKEFAFGHALTWWRDVSEAYLLRQKYHPVWDFFQKTSGFRTKKDIFAKMYIIQNLILANISWFKLKLCFLSKENLKWVKSKPTFLLKTRNLLYPDCLWAFHLLGFEDFLKGC